VFKNTDLKQAISLLEGSMIQHAPLFVFISILSLFNWSIEAKKWHHLVNKIEKISFLTALKGILFGITFSLFTPNRLGEYGGRVMVLKHNRITAIAATLIGSYAQIVANLTIGASAFILYCYFFQQLNFILFAVLFFLFIIAIVALYISYFNLSSASRIFSKIPIFKKLHNYVSIVEKYSFHEFLILLLLSFLRYTVYCVQFGLLLYVFDIKCNYIVSLIHIPSIFFIQTILPSFAIADIGVRSEIAIQIMQNISTNNLNIVAATVMLWLINLIIPGILGAITALGFKFFSEEQE
jgi:uncharacterized membrane protein YbhN (UPF0104 family)